MPRSRSSSALLAGALLLTVLAPGALGDQEALGKGTYVPNGSKITAEIGNAFHPTDDVDDYTVDGYTGQTVSITVAASKSSNLIPFVDLIRPDGTVVTIQEGAKISPAPLPSLKPSKTVKIAYKCDVTGAWTIRVKGGWAGKILKDDPTTPDLNEGDDPATEKIETQRVIYDFRDDQGVDKPRTAGVYTLSAKYGAPPAASSANATPDVNGQYRFIVPGAGGATMSAALTFKGGTPTFVSLTDPSGRPISAGVASVKPGKSVTYGGIAIPAASTLGGYSFVFQADPVKPSTKVAFKTSLKLPKAPKPLKTPFAKEEPSIISVNPARGGPNIQVVLGTTNVVDEANPTGPLSVRLGRIAIDPADIVTVLTGKNASVRFTTPAEDKLPEGAYDIRVTSSSGQSAVLSGGFVVVPPPVGYTIDPIVGSAAGGFPVTITGANFNAKLNGMKIRFRSLTASQIIEPPISFPLGSITDSTLTFQMPLNFLIAGEYAVQVQDVDTQRFAELTQHLTLSSTAAINRVTPGLVPVLGGETMYVSGSNFLSTDKVYLELTPGSGGGAIPPLDNSGYEEITATQPSFQHVGLHQFVAPVRQKGVYRVYVRDVNGYQTPTRSFAYYSFADFTATLGIGGGADGFDAWSTALADMDKDGDLDLFLSRRGGATTMATTSETRVLRNAGNGSFTDVTSLSMPLVITGEDDWRADRIWVTDVTQDGYPDIVIVTNSDRFPPADTKSHVRFLVNERRISTGPITDRSFRDRTPDLMAPIRTMSYLYGTSGQNDKDAWRGLDMWIGDLDLSNGGVPEIVIVTDRKGANGVEGFENFYVSCTPYCASPYSGGYTYSFYWGNTRVFKWDPAARSGLGRYKYQQNFFPRKSGITVPIFNPPPGVTVPVCANSCRNKFTPFSGQKIAVGPLDGDGKPDFAILSNADVKRDASTTSSLQVAINKVGSDGSNISDVTDKIYGLASTDNFKADAVAIGQPGYPDGNGFGVIAIAKADPTGLTGSTSALRLLRFKPSVLPTDPGDFQNITTQTLPVATANDRFQSSAISFADVDLDGDTDMITVAKAAPGGASSAFRIFRNEVVASTSGIFTQALAGLIDANVNTPTQHFDGTVLAVGDIDGDGALDFVVTRSTTAGATAPHTRAVRTDK